MHQAPANRYGNVRYRATIIREAIIYKQQKTSLAGGFYGCLKIYLSADLLAALAKRDFLRAAVFQ